MINIGAYLQYAIDFYKISLSITDMSYSKVNGQDQRSVSATRTIEAAVDPSRSKTMERIFGGSLGDGDIGIFTTETLYIEDGYVIGSTRLQSFVSYQGKMYRISDVGDWQPQVGIHVYLAKRHHSQDVL